METLSKRTVAEAVGTAFLLAAIVGSGIAAERLSSGNVGLALLCNAIATGAALVTLILVFGPISGAHLNPLVSLAFALRGDLPRSALVPYIGAQIVGALAGVAIAHLMFGAPLIELSDKIRAGSGQTIAEAVATFGLLVTIFGCVARNATGTPYAVGLYIAAAYWFTASTSFANPAVTIARAFTKSFAGIAMADVPVFIVAQCVGAVAAYFFAAWMWPRVRPESKSSFS
ncbi:MAG: MIP/aquaporin family protein [Pseudomonadota bacterium]